VGSHIEQQLKDENNVEEHVQAVKRLLGLRPWCGSDLILGNIASKTA
jgi:predicted ATP-grasp superfamily ATP-dependent carboligase